MPVSRRPASLLLAAALLALGGCGAARSADDAGGPVGAVWVADEGGDSLTVLDATTGAVVATLSGIATPHNVQASSDGGAVLATSGAGAIVRLDATDLTVSGHASTGGHPAHVVDDADGQVYVTAAVDRVIHRYDAALRPRGAIRLTGAPHGLRLHEQRGIAVVANTGGGTLDVVDLGSGTVVGRTRVGSGPVQAAVTEDGSRAFVSVSSTREVVAVDLGSGEIVARARTPHAPAQILLTDRHLVVADHGTPIRPGTSVIFLDPDDLTVVGSVTTGRGPHGLASDPSGDHLWVTNAFDDTLSVIDVPALEVTATVPVGNRPLGVSYSPAVAVEPAHHPMPLLLPHEIAHPTDDGHAHDHDGGHGRRPRSR